MHVAGKVVADSETSKLADKLIGRPPSAADEELGQPVDVWRDLSGLREWRAYKVKFDILDQKRIVVAVVEARIVEIQMIQKHGSEADIPLELYYYAKAKGKSPKECQAELGLGPPLLSVRSVSTGQLMQVYDARLIKELPTQSSCLVRFDNSERCTKLDLVEVESTSH
jgi:hypothetical protein